MYLFYAFTVLVADGAIRPGRQGSVSKADTVSKKQRSSKRERTLGKDNIPGNFSLY